MEHVRQCRPDTFFTTVSYPIRGTPYYERVASKLVSIGGWEDRTDRDFAVRGRHSRQFYRHADALLKGTMAEQPDAAGIEAARKALRGSRLEVEA